MYHKKVAVLALLGALACAVNPVTGRNELSLVSESQEIQMGQQGRVEVGQSIGVYEDDALTAYVSGLGMQLARASERPELPWSFQIADQPVVNAFALPGGPIFVARGILPYFNSEAELVSVLGHEIGHVTARHSAQQITRSQLAGLGLGVASIVDSRVARYAGVAQAGLGLLLLKYGRDAESQADAVGFRYGLAGGWDMRDGTNMFNTLAAVTGDAGAGLPEWQSSHPAPAGRAEANESRVRAAEARGIRFETLRVERNGYLRRLEGLVYGEDPRQGYFEGTRFYHPTLKLTFAFPSGWQTQNSPASVAGISAAKDAIMIFSGSGTESPQAVARRFAAQEGLVAGQGQALTINGLTAYALPFRAETEQGTIAGRAVWVALDGTTYQILGYGGAANAGANDPIFLSVARSFGRLTDQSKLNVTPKRVRIVQLRAPQTIIEAGRANGNTIPDVELARINGVRTDQVIATGTLVKIVK